MMIYNEDMRIANPQELKKAADYLAEHDPVLAPIIQRAGPADFKPHQDYYNALVSSIIGQQLSVKAAASIKRRFEALFGDKLPSPEAILAATEEDLRGVGLSRPKIKYIKDLAQHILDDKIDFTKLNMLSNEQVIAELTDVKGIGEWTVHMFLMFCMGRLDVLAVGDLGIRNGVRDLYGLPELPDPEAIKKIAETNQWHPYESVACWYIWHSLDNKPA
jgi:DNA-3-methyladenine glycosylase II